MSRIADSIENSESLGNWGEALHDKVSPFFRPGRVRDLLSGTWLGHPAHPFLVATPIGCWTCASLLDMVGGRRVAQLLVGAGVLSVAPTALTGLSDWVDTAGAEQRTGLVHLALNTCASSIYATSWWARRRGHNEAGVVLAIAGALVASTAGWLGGHLAYALGVGVDTNAFDGGPTQWTAVDGPLPGPGSHGSASAGGIALIVVDDGDADPKVLADRCSHRGGPLSEGDVRDGCVTCPWHGSRFDLRSGEVRRGPAVVAQPTYQVRRRGPEVQVRRDEPRALRTNTARPG